MTYEYSNYLEHKGVRGMKWGKWNDETRQRYTGTGGERRSGKSSSESNNSNGAKRRQTTEAQKDTARKLIVAAGAAALVGLAAYGAYKGYKASGNLKNELIRQAKEKTDEYNGKSMNAFFLNKSYSEQAMKNRAQSLNPARSNGVRAAYRDNMTRNMRYAREQANNRRLFDSKSLHYSGVTKSATRTKAVKNWIKNRGKIDVSNL